MVEKVYSKCIGCGRMFNIFCEGEALEMLEHDCNEEGEDDE